MSFVLGHYSNPCLEQHDLELIDISDFYTRCSDSEAMR